LTKRVEVQVFGRVQGVGFRWYTVQQAQRLGLTGSVRNLPDGSVRIVAEGEKNKLDAFVSWLGHGPPHAHVASTEVQWFEARQEFDDFLVTG
jgi:acylphosphatase